MFWLVEVVEIVIFVIKFLPGIRKVDFIYVFLFTECLKQTVKNVFVVLNYEVRGVDLAYVKYALEFVFIFIIKVDHFLQLVVVHWAVVAPWVNEISDVLVQLMLLVERQRLPCHLTYYSINMTVNQLKLK